MTKYFLGFMIDLKLKIPNLITKRNKSCFLAEEGCIWIFILLEIVCKNSLREILTLKAFVFRLRFAFNEKPPSFISQN